MSDHDWAPFSLGGAGGGECNTKFLMLMDMSDGLNENLTWDIYYIARCMLNTHSLSKKCL